MTSYAHVFKGNAFSSQDSKTVQFFENTLFCINHDGIIEKILQPTDSDYFEFLKHIQSEPCFYALEDGQYFLPGFVDIHVHAPQWAQAGTALDKPLYDWLNSYTFPIESKFSDLTFAESVYSDLVDTLLANGTTTALYFATIHKESSLLLAHLCSQKGQRGLIGKVVMDDKQQNPDYYRDKDAKTALEDTEEFILSVKELAQSTKQGVYPVVTPRFIPSCTDEALEGLGTLARKYNTHIQSHCSESDWAHQYVQARCHKNDAVALHDFGLLGQKSVMAHCNFLTDDDAQVFKKTGTAIGHCPISNAYFANSVIPIAHFHSMGIDVGLGSDLSGGFSPSLFDNVRQAVMSSRMLEDGVNPRLPASERGLSDAKVTINEAFYFATAGGGESLDLPIGRLAENYVWDVQVIDTKAKNAKLPIFDTNEPFIDVLQKILYLARPENIKEVWVQGEKVHTRF